VTGAGANCLLQERNDTFSRQIVHSDVQEVSDAYITEALESNYCEVLG